MRYGLAAVACGRGLGFPPLRSASDNSSLRRSRSRSRTSGRSPGTATITNDHRVWPTAAITVEQRRALVGNMPTQVLFGERVLVLERQGAWTKIAVPDQPSPLDRRGYPGWVRELAAPPRRVRPRRPSRSRCRRAKLSNGREVSFGTQLPGDPAAARRRFVVRTPTGAVARLPARRREAAPAHARRPRPQREAVPRPAATSGAACRRGATTAPGLTWAVYRAHGITIPRDADAQFTAGRAISLEDAKPGDLIFYGTSFVHHVTMYLGRGLMIEAPNSASEVRIVPVRTDDFAGVRTFLGRY